MVMVVGSDSVVVVGGSVVVILVLVGNSVWVSGGDLVTLV